MVASVINVSPCATSHNPPSTRWGASRAEMVPSSCAQGSSSECHRRRGLACGLIARVRRTRRGGRESVPSSITAGLGRSARPGRGGVQSPVPFRRSLRPAFIAGNPQTSNGISQSHPNLILPFPPRCPGERPYYTPLDREQCDLPCISGYEYNLEILRQPPTIHTIVLDRHALKNAYPDTMDK